MLHCTSTDKDHKISLKITTNWSDCLTATSKEVKPPFEIIFRCGLILSTMWEKLSQCLRPELLALTYKFSFYARTIPEWNTLSAEGTDQCLGPLWFSYNTFLYICGTDACVPLEMGWVIAVSELFLKREVCHEHLLVSKPMEPFL